MPMEESSPVLPDHKAVYSVLVYSKQLSRAYGNLFWTIRPEFSISRHIFSFALSEMASFTPRICAHKMFI